MAELNSKELLQNIKDAIQAKPPKLGQDYFTPSLHYAAINYALVSERDRFIALLDNELDQCTCEDPLRHLRERVLMIAVKGEGENK